MKEIRIEYPVLFLFRKTKILQAPEEWTDMNGKQFAVCARAHTETVSDGEFISGFFGIKKSTAKRLSKFQQYKLIETAGFISMPKASVNFFYLPEIPGTRLRAPKERLKDVTLEHFSFFDTFFFDYINGKQDKELAKFIAALYLKKGEKVTGVDFDSRINYITKKVDKSTQYAIFLNYTFIRKWLSDAFPSLLGFSEEKEKKKASRPKRPNRPDWNAVLDALTGEDVVNYEKYRQLSCIVAFRAINKRIQNYSKHGK
jgi:hypothetical protein